MSRKRKARPGVPSGTPRDKGPLFGPRAEARPERQLHRYCVVRRLEPTARWDNAQYEVDYRDRKVTIEEPALLDRRFPEGLRPLREHPVRGGVGLKVGRHGHKLGVVFIVRKRGRSKAEHTERSHGNLDRGLVEWDGRTAASLRKAVAEMALRHSGIAEPSEAVVRALEKEWKDLPLWKDLADRTALGGRMQAVREVMEA